MTIMHVERRRMMHIYADNKCIRGFIIIINKPTIYTNSATVASSACEEEHCKQVIFFTASCTALIKNKLSACVCSQLHVL